MPANAPLPEAECEAFARLLSSGVTPQLAYTESRVGVLKACTIDQAQRLPGMWARVEWLKANQVVQVALTEKPMELDIDPKSPRKEQIISMLLRDHQLARQMGQTSAAVKAAELIGKQIGMFIERQQIDVSVFDRMELHEQRALLEAIEIIDIKPN